MCRYHRLLTSFHSENETCCFDALLVLLQKKEINYSMRHAILDVIENLLFPDDDLESGKPLMCIYLFYFEEQFILYKSLVQSFYGYGAATPIFNRLIINRVVPINSKGNSYQGFPLCTKFHLHQHALRCPAFEFISDD